MVANSLPACASQMVTIPSMQPHTIFVASGEMAQCTISSRCHPKELISAPVTASHNSSASSPAHEAINLRSPEKSHARPSTGIGSMRSTPVSTSQILTLLSFEAVNIRLPSGEYAQAIRGDPSVACEMTSAGFRTFQIFKVPSSDEDATCDPSGEKPQSLIAAVCPENAAISRPVRASQSRSELSVEPEAIRLPSLENAQHVIWALALSQISTSVPVLTSYTLNL